MTPWQEVKKKKIESNSIGALFLFNRHEVLIMEE